MTENYLRTTPLNSKTRYYSAPSVTLPNPYKKATSGVTQPQNVVVRWSKTG